MISNLKTPIVIAIAALLLGRNAMPVEAADWKLLPAGCHDVDLTVDGDVIDIRTTGSDPYLLGRLDGPRNRSERILELEYFCTRGIGSFSAYHGPPISEANRIDLPDLSIAEGWQTYTADLQQIMQAPLPQSSNRLRLDLGTEANVRIQIRGIRLRPANGNELADIKTRESERQEKKEHSRRVAAYLKGSFPLEPNVRVGTQWIDVAFDLPENDLPENDEPLALTPDLDLVEYSANDSIGDQAPPACDDARASIDGKRMTFRVPRHASGRDRVQSGWRIWSRPSGTFVSGRRFASRITPRSTDHAPSRPSPQSQKGLSGFSRRGPKEDLDELGIHAVTINLVLNRFVSTRPIAGREPIDAPGPAVYFDSRAFAEHDSLIGFASEHDVVVSAIVLIPRSRRGSQPPLVHPEADGGVYAMPDLQSERGVKIYAHVLDKIAERYRNHERAPGAITNWIAHNEVDFHPVWTNMGRQPRELYTETYYRSMRMIHNAARTHNPHARVFASLTHHWIVPDDGKWQQLAPRDVLETLQAYSRLENDFAWGVAYHPYPQNLFAEVAWRDKKISDDFETPLITIQNLQVLGRFLEQDSMRDSAGNTRPVLLSEQGFHSKSYQDDAQANQAGSLWYAMKKVRDMPFIESFHYHRWIDHPAEGGLLLGLRTLPESGQPHGQRKRAWHVYQAIDTDREAEVTDGLPGPQR